MDVWEVWMLVKYNLSATLRVQATLWEPLLPSVVLSSGFFRQYGLISIISDEGGGPPAFEFPDW